ncbi:zinc ABC transporter ATP-binding protein AztA [Brucellaceae bacterium C25G]
MSDTCLTFKELTLGYNNRPVMQNLTGTIQNGTLTAIVGGNGSGKSTLMKAMAGLLKPISGTCTINTDARIAYLPQQSDVDRTFPARVHDLVSLGLWQYCGLLGRHRSEHKIAVKQALSAVGLKNFDKHPIDALSGGQMQRALFARVIVQNADIILLDEPFNAVDERTIGDLLVLIKSWHQEGRTVIVIVHDLQLVRDHFPEALLLANYPIAWGKTDQALSIENLSLARNAYNSLYRYDLAEISNDGCHLSFDGQNGSAQ